MDLSEEEAVWVFSFFALGASSSELESESELEDEEDSLLEEALRFNPLTLAFGTIRLTFGFRSSSSSSSASLSELLEAEDEEEMDAVLAEPFFTCGASTIST